MSEGKQMKWVIDNLGITRETIKYYDSKGLISPHREPSSNNRRIFDEDDLEDLWTVKLLMETGFSSGEILAMQRGELDFADSIGDKVDQLERDIESKQIALSFVKTIKLTGQIPSLKNMGDMTFQDFFEYSQNNWNFADDESLAAIKKMTDSLDPLKQCGTESFTEDDVDRLVDFFRKFRGNGRSRYPGNQGRHPRVPSPVDERPRTLKRSSPNRDSGIIRTSWRG